MKTARVILAENIRTLMAENPHLSSQNAVGKASSVGQTTIGNWLRQEYSSQRLEQVEAVASVFRIPVALLLTENLGRNIQKEKPAFEASSEAQRLIDRIYAAEKLGSSSPQLINALNAMLDVIEPDTSALDPSGYSRLNGAFKD